ncbi:hypothetical protein BCR34DRAFT_575924 [Clohesyomyces aquaticus]|uniref:Small ribosomal subunit protein uS10m n=1 Tax=Clohesyomyces aquaticus TaxID=1231657 RepID=A0A1Y1YQJ4_9PLEO|nr:hypothetical protein BCR34DRAFT_575924 [Clohesyomyces aquaticus]
MRCRAMAAPTCTRSLFGPAKRIRLFPARPYISTFSRAASRRAGDESGISFNPSMDLETQLDRMGVSMDEYTQVWRSMQGLKERQDEWEPKTKAEAEKKWEEMRKTPDHHTMLHMYKHQGIEVYKLAKERGVEIPGGEKPPRDPELQKRIDAVRTPVNVQAVKLRPLRHTPKYGIPVCDLQLRTYSIRNIIFFADFAMRAAYYMGLSARGPIPLPRITERWTVPRSNFIFKKSQENFERVTLRRLIQIQDGHPDVVKAWLAFLMKHQYQGVGMKANVWEFESLEDATGVGKPVEERDYAGRREGPTFDKVNEILSRPGYKEAMAGYKKPAELAQVGSLV